MQNDWLYSISIQTKRLLLKIPQIDEISLLAITASNGIQPENQPHFQEDALYDKSKEELEMKFQKDIEGCIANWDKNDWHIPFTIFFDNNAIGMVTLFAKRFPVARGFGCGYWIGSDHQGNGLATESTQAILSFGFGKLHAREAYLGAWSDNIPSLHIMEKLGFIPNGEYWMERQGKAVKDRRMRLPSENFKTLKRFHLMELMIL